MIQFKKKTTVALRMMFKLYVNEFGFYISAFSSLEITGDKTDNSCNSTSGPSQPKLSQHAAVKTYKDNAISDLSEKILSNTNSGFRNPNNTESNHEFDTKSTILQEVQCVCVCVCTHIHKNTHTEWPMNLCQYCKIFFLQSFNVGNVIFCVHAPCFLCKSRAVRSSDCSGHFC
jgi:hypothetical protein